jgi:hypothetical protein
MGHSRTDAGIFPELDIDEVSLSAGKVAGESSPRGTERTKGHAPCPRLESRRIGHYGRLPGPAAQVLLGCPGDLLQGHRACLPDQFPGNGRRGRQRTRCEKKMAKFAASAGTGSRAISASSMRCVRSSMATRCA